MRPYAVQLPSEPDTQLPVVIIVPKGKYDWKLEIKRRDEYEAAMSPSTMSLRRITPKPTLTRTKV